ncbi:unnamed protein product [Albugo candida]|uniref:Uncharacterized protein n=1 Tax=Albugo candida TaxID=65357 RepID=A0A024FXZ5_9STRA|nr:unnamed protein product [Albugo candida]|eukprot:CCI11802.1 unnamed protein product [Albugo candida]
MKYAQPESQALIISQHNQYRTYLNQAEEIVSFIQVLEEDIKLLQCSQAGHLDRNCGKKARPKENESKRISRPSNGNKWAFDASSCDDLNDDDWILVTVYKLSFGP